MKQLQLEDIKRLQCEVLKAIDEFCAEHEIRYSLACGTLLGAIRHKGYIPWDDDIDIYMLRADYARFISDFPQLYKNKYKVASIERESAYNRTYAKAYDDSTIFREPMSDGIDMGIGIDVYPIDQVPDEEKEWLKYDSWRRKVQKLKYSLKDSRLFKGSDERPVWKTIILLVARVLLFWLPSRTITLYMNRLAQKFNGTDSAYVFENSQGILVKKRFKKEVFDNLIEVPFEQYHFKAFANYDEYLRNAYGDYMQLPPVEQQVTHHEFVAYRK